MATSSSIARSAASPAQAVPSTLARPSTGSWNSFSSARAGCSRASNCSTASGAAISISTSAPWMCMSVGCARPSIAATWPTRSAPCAGPAIRSTTASGGRAELTSKRALVAPPVGHGLVGDARVIGAIRLLVRVLAATEEEFRAARIADRPTAGLVGQLQQGLALLERDFDQFRLGLDFVFVGQRGVAPHRGPRHPHHARGTGLARPWRGRGRAFGAAGEAEAVDLADHRVAGDAAEFRRDLAGGQAVRPQFLEEFDPFVGPAHLVFPFTPKALDRIQPRRRALFRARSE